MPRERWKMVLLSLAVLLLAALTTMAAAPRKVGSHEPIVKRATNRPLASLKAAAQRSRARVRRIAPPHEIENFITRGLPGRAQAPGENAAAIAASTFQDSQGSGETTIGSGFFGTDNNDNGSILGFLVAPPDTDGAVGSAYYVQMINLLTTIFDKSGSVVLGPFASNAFWDGMGGNCEPYNQGDAVVLYDDVNDRWLVSQFAFPDDQSTYSQCVAISQTGDPTGGYNRYEFSFEDYGFNDYPKHGIVTDSITMTANLFIKRGKNFSFGGTFLGVMDKSAMYAGQPASLIGFNIGSGEFGFIAGDLDGTGNVPALFATAMSTADAFDLWEIDVDWSTGNATVNQVASIPVSPFSSELCSDSRGACIPQPDGGPALESLSDRLMHRLQMRDFGTYRTMVTAHTIDVGNGRAGIRWYELRESGGNWSLYQEGTFAPNDGEYRWMPSAAMNANGDIGIGYMVASTSTYVSTAVVGQTAANSGTGVLDSAEAICAAGSGVQTAVSRSGDYSATSVDPATGNFWHTNEVFTTTGDYQWATFVCEFSVGEGTPPVNQPPVASFSYSCTGLDCTFTDSSTDSDGTITGWSWDFGDGATSQAQNPSHSYAATGTYTVTLTVTDDDGATGSTSQSVSVSSAANEPPTASFTYSCTDLGCNFDASTSSDSDGSITDYSWSFGDGDTGSGVTTSHTYGAAGTYTVTLTVTDDDGATASTTQSVSVTEPPAGDITLTVSGRKSRGTLYADLAWSGASGADVDVYRDGAFITTTANDGAYTDVAGRGAGTFVYKVCEAGTNVCSNEVTVTF
ncbi:MAG: PKD domain-containing protein [Acidobacteria bacterium]|nr:PKD domain-containing protein [Acidobacteriota bacterium]